MSAIRRHSFTRPARWRRLVAAVLAAMCVGLGLAAAPAAATPAPPAQSREQIFRQLGVDAVPADYVILVDTSNSMFAGNLYSNVRGVLSQFLFGLAPSDYVALYTFDSSPQRRYSASAANRAAILKALPHAPTPRGKTDIGLAIEQALNELNRSGAASIATVVLLTDGQQDAPASSPYRSTTAPAWQNLKSRAALLNKTWLGAYALPLRAQTGASLLRTVIPSTVVLDPSTGSGLASYLDQSKQATRVAKARALLAADKGKGVQAAWKITASDLAAGTWRVRLSLESLTQRVPLTVTGLGVTAASGVSWSGHIPSSVSLPPGRAQAFTLTVHWKPSAGLQIWPHAVSKSPALSLTGQVGSPWAAALAPDIPLNVPGQASTDGTVSLSMRVGSWLAVEITAGVLLLVVGLLALFMYVRAYPRLPRGTIGVYEVSARPDQDFQRIDQFPVRRRRVTYTSAVGPASQLSGQPERATIRVRGRRVATTTYAGRHIGLETTLVRDDIRGTTTHTIRPANGGLVGGLYMLHVPRGGDVPTQLRVAHDGAPVTEASPWTVSESEEDDHDAVYGDENVITEPSLWSDQEVESSVALSEDMP